MTFLEALKTGRPIRRMDDKIDPPWLFLGTEGTATRRPCWRRIDTGEIVGLWLWDYEAADWEVMP